MAESGDRVEGHQPGVGIFCIACGTVRDFHEPACTCQVGARSEPIAFEAARLLRSLAQAREDLLVQCDEWDALAKGEFPLTIRIRELVCLCTPDASPHEHSKGGYR